MNTRLGDWTGWLAVAGLVFFTFGGKWLEKKGRAKDKEQLPVR